MAQIGPRDALAAAIIALLAGLATMLPPLDAMRGASIDALTGLERHLRGQTSAPATSPVVVVALDEETYRTPPFAGSPNITWTGEIARVLTAIIEAGAQVVGFDIIYPTSIEQSEIPFGGETLGTRVRGFDREFLRALALASRDGKIVLGQAQFRDQPILPSPGQRIAVGHQRNIRALNTYTDPDDIVRRLPLSFLVDGERVPSMAVELAARALQSTPAVEPDGRLTLAGYRIPSPKHNTMTLNFAGSNDNIPTFSLADLHTCVEKGDREFFRRHFDKKVVIFGALLDVEDLKLTSNRWAGVIESARAERCALPMPVAEPRFAHSLTSGVYIHATGVKNLIERTALNELGPVGSVAVSIAFSIIVATAALSLTPINSVIAYTAAVLAWTGLAFVTFWHALALPLVEPFLAGLIATVVTFGYRFVVSDKDKLLLRKSFSLYLAPSVVERMMTSHKLPELGGESRTTTIYFSDLAGFSSLSEKLDPTEVVVVMNEYFSAMSDIIEEHGGIHRKIHRRRHPRRVRRAARRSGSCPQRRASGLALPGAHGPAELQRSRVHGPSASTAHRSQLRESPGRQHRVAPTVQLHGHGGRREPRLPARGRQQIFRNIDHCFGHDGRSRRINVRLAGARRDPGRRTVQRSHNLRAFGGDGAADHGAIGARGGLCARFSPLAG